MSPITTWSGWVSGFSEEKRVCVCVCVYTPTCVGCVVLGEDGLWEKDKSNFPSWSGH